MHGAATLPEFAIYLSSPLLCTGTHHRLSWLLSFPNIYIHKSKSIYAVDVLQLMHKDQAIAYYMPA